MRFFRRLMNRPLFRTRTPLSTEPSQPHTITRLFRNRSSKTKPCTVADTDSCYSIAATMASGSTARDMVDSTAATIASASTTGDMVDSTAVNDTTGPSTTANAIAQLSAHQLEALDGLVVGDLLFIVAVDDDAAEDDARESDEDEGQDSEDVDGDDEEQTHDDADSAAEGDVEGDDEGDDDGEDEEDTSSAGENNEDEDESADDNTDPDTAAALAHVDTPPSLFIVTDIISDDGGVIKDVKLKKLTYSQVAEVDKCHSFQVYGNEIVHHDDPKACNQCKDTLSIADTVPTPDHLIINSPQGDYVRHADHTIASNARQQCIPECRNGWLPDRGVVNLLIAGHDSPILAWNGDLEMDLQHSVCPVCVGLDLFKAQEALQLALLTNGHSNFDAIVDHAGDLNARRAALGYPFCQFDERLWGFYFDDMDGEDGGGDGGMDGGWNDPYEHFPEALDPNAYIRMNPASEATIQALPRKLFVETGSSAAECAVCMDPLKKESVVIVLPCGHSEHHAECLELWLRQQETCTVCRRVVPTAKAVGGAMVEQEEDNSEEAIEPTTPALHDDVDMHPGFPGPSKDAAEGNITVPQVLPSLSWATADDDSIMSDE